MKFFSAVTAFSLLVGTQGAPSWDAPPSLKARQDNKCLPQIYACGYCHYWWNNKETPDGGPANVCLIAKNGVSYWALTCSYCNKQPECSGACMENVVPGFWNNTGDV
ncbi:hypothetical protein FKW77_003297 [Venturia effusa]|uniref:Uncharacterized protein n=1 Tax=Venturia effusa TaxID=50376 RepID=A0A517L518_9PEZI|nr:hypothetical protein FKW77_003297 [Venturia effusa]